MKKRNDDIDSGLCIIEQDADIFVGKKKLTKEDREFMEIGRVEDL